MQVQRIANLGTQKTQKTHAQQLNYMSKMSNNSIGDTVSFGNKYVRPEVEELLGKAIAKVRLFSRLDAFVEGIGDVTVHDSSLFQGSRQNLWQCVIKVSNGAKRKRETEKFYYYFGDIAKSKVIGMNKSEFALGKNFSPEELQKWNDDVQKTLEGLSNKGLL